MEEHIELLEVIKELYHLSGFRITVFDPEFNIIETYPGNLCGFCRYVQENGQRSACVENDRRAFELVRGQKKIHIYKCCFGLYEAVAPIYSMGTLTGYLMMGQVIEDSPESSENVLRSAAALMGGISEGLERAVGESPAGDRERLLSCIKIMDVCSKYITLRDRLHQDKTDLAEHVRGYIDSNFGGEITIEKLCARFFCSRTTVINTFKRRYGYGINRYLTRVRIDNARVLLETTSKSMKEIAAESGFSDQNYFSKVFMKETGLPPSKYRAAHRIRHAADVSEND